MRHWAAQPASSSWWQPAWTSTQLGGRGWQRWRHMRPPSCLTNSRDAAAAVMQSSPSRGSLASLPGEAELSSGLHVVHRGPLHFSVIRRLNSSSSVLSVRAAKDAAVDSQCSWWIQQCSQGGSCLQLCHGCSKCHRVKVASERVDEVSIVPLASQAFCKHVPHRPPFAPSGAAAGAGGQCCWAAVLQG